MPIVAATLDDLVAIVRYRYGGISGLVFHAGLVEVLCPLRDGGLGRIWFQRDRDLWVVAEVQA